MKKVLVLGAEGYLGKALVEYLTKYLHYDVHCVDKDTVNLKYVTRCMKLFSSTECEEIYQLAANSGSIEYLLSNNYSYGDSTLINLSIVKALKETNFKGRILFPSTFYAYDSENKYGLEKLYNESIYLQSGLDVRIPRLFSVYGPGEIINSPQEKVTTAFCRKIIEKRDRDSLVIKGHPLQSRYFLYKDDAIKGLVSHMNSDIIECDLGGDKSISLEMLIDTIIEISKKEIMVSWTGSEEIKTFHPFPTLDWKPEVKFKDGIEKLYRWVDNELH